MPLFNRKKPAPPPAAAPAKAAPRKGPPYDPFMGDEMARSLYPKLEAGSWEEAASLLDGLRDWESRGFYVATLSQLRGRPPVLDAWCDARPDSSAAALLRGAHTVQWAWEARGGGRGSTVSQEAAQLFYERLAMADRQLLEAAEMEPEDPTPHAQRLWSALGLQLGQAELQRRWQEVERRDPLNSAGIQAMIQGIARKWGGSHDAMFQFARSITASAPEGHAAHTAIALAHIERWLDFSRKDGELDAKRAYFRGPEVGAEVEAAAQGYLYSPSLVTTKWLNHNRNVFALCFRLMRAYRQQLEQMEIIGPHFYRFPWSYVGDPGWAYEQSRKDALAGLAKAESEGSPA